MINMRADAEWEVDALWLQSCDLFAQQVNRRRIVLANTSKQLFVALVAAEDCVRKIKEDDGSFGEECVAFILLAALRHRLACCGGNRNGARVDNALTVARVARASTR